ncbi:hypothetical protein ACFLT1_09910 [Bacteroidota bacterium]
MKNSIDRLVSFSLIFAMGIILTFTSCEQQPEQMKLPPKDALSIDLKQFPSNTTKSAELTAANWLYSYVTVFAWNVVLVVNVAVPVIAYAEALDRAPVFLGDYTWEWSYDITVQQIDYHVSLIGSRIDNENFSVEMNLSRKDSLFYDFKWFEGVVRYNHTMADWTISHSPDNPTEYLDIHFEKDFITEVSSIRYTVIDPNNELYNAYIEYGLDPGLDLDAYYTIAKSDNTTSIEWSRISNAGRVMDMAHFQDDLWHCWDTTLQDFDCSMK